MLVVGSITEATSTATTPAASWRLEYVEEEDEEEGLEGNDEVDEADKEMDDGNREEEQGVLEEETTWSLVIMVL